VPDPDPVRDSALDAAGVDIRDPREAEDLARSTVAEQPHDQDPWRAAGCRMRIARQGIGTRHNLAVALRTVGGVARDRGQRAEGCAAFQRAFELMQTLGERDRSQGIDRKTDPLPRVAAEAAACGDKRAREWLAADGVSR
jgi:hypothetical protein